MTMSEQTDQQAKQLSFVPCNSCILRSSGMLKSLGHNMQPQRYGYHAINHLKEGGAERDSIWWPPHPFFFYTLGGALTHVLQFWRVF